MLPRVYQLSLLPSEHVQRFILWSLPRGDTCKIQGLLLLLEKEIILRFISPGVYLRRVEHFDDQNVTSSPRLGVHHCATAFLCHCPPCLQVCNGPQEPAPRPCRLPNHTVHELPSGKLIHFEIMYLGILYSISKNVRIEVTSSCCFFFFLGKGCCVYLLVCCDDFRKRHLPGREPDTELHCRDCHAFGRR